LGGRPRRQDYVKSARGGALRRPPVAGDRFAAARRGAPLGETDAGKLLSCGCPGFHDAWVVTVRDGEMSLYEVTVTKADGAVRSRPLARWVLLSDA
jgi:hypothetical protein